MTTNHLIEAYVTDVARRLPCAQRNDVAFELRALLHEELQARAEAAGREADPAMATELLRGFGRPAEVAARYRPALTIVDPADGRAFLRATVAGLAIIWVLGLLLRLRQPLGSAPELLRALGEWWGGTVIPSLWWPGLLVVGFGAAAWARRRWPRTAEWTPRAGNRVEASRAALVLGLAGIVCGVLVLVEPRWFLDLLLGGRATPAAQQAFAYSDTFRRSQAPWLLGLILLNVPLLIVVLAHGRWTVPLRRAHTALSLGTCAFLAWIVLDGPMYAAPATDRTAKAAIVVLVALTLGGIARRTVRSVRPAPEGSVGAAH
jgi:hypothetical protein